MWLRLDLPRVRWHWAHRNIIWLLLSSSFHDLVEVLLYIHRNRRFIRDGSPGRPPRLSHSSWALSRSRTYLNPFIAAPTAPSHQTDQKSPKCDILKTCCCCLIWNVFLSCLRIGIWKDLHQNARQWKLMLQGRKKKKKIPFAGVCVHGH